VESNSPRVTRAAIAPLLRGGPDADSGDFQLF